MKKALIVFITVVVLGFMIRYLIVYEDFYVEAFQAGKPLQVESSSDEDSLYIHNGANGKEPFKIKGVLVDSCMPGHYSNDFAPTEAQYFSWLEQISNMGANTVSVYSVMDPDFYNALARFNKSKAQPLYLLQGITIPDYNANNGQDAYGFFDILVETAETAVNIIHGNEMMALGRVQGGGNYIHDISQWTLGYVIGTDWVPYTVAYTDHNQANPTSYAGQYFQTTQGTTAMEALLAQVLDRITDYETNRYRTQRLIGFSNSLATDPLTYTADVRMQLDKCASVNANHVQPTKQVLSGYFAAYWMRGEMTAFLSCLSVEDEETYKDILPLVDSGSIYGGYAQFLALMHDMPVVVANFGFSTARGIDEEEGQGRGPFTEQAQGEAIVDAYQGFMEAGFQGAVVSTWQDNWSRTTWNTMFAVDEEKEPNWYDVQSLSNCFGILAFEPGAEKSACYVDGDPGEWLEFDRLLSTEGYSLSARYDAAYFYLLAQSENIRAPLYIPLDVTPRSGSTSVQERPVRFERYADFLIELSGGEDARVLVQERYDAARMEFEERISGKNPFYEVPDSHTDLFEPIRNVLKIPFDPSIPVTRMSPAQRALYKLYGTRETGILTYGNGNPSAPDYNSLADFCYGAGCVEIRIPWQLLNFSDPSNMKIHDDYYPVYGVGDMNAEGVYVGIGRQDSRERIPFGYLPLEGWDGQVQYRERLKQSYAVIQAAWTGGEAR